MRLRRERENRGDGPTPTRRFAPTVRSGRLGRLQGREELCSNFGVGIAGLVTNHEEKNTTYHDGRQEAKAT